MLNRDHVRTRFADSDSEWVRSFDLSAIKCLIVCRGPVRKETMDVFDDIGVGEYGMLLSEKDSIVYPQCLAPELRGFRFPHNIHRVPDYTGSGQAEKQQRIAQIIRIGKRHNYTHLFAGYGFMAEDAEFIAAIEEAGLGFMGPSSHVARAVGAKDEAKRLARELGISVTPGVDNVSSLAVTRRCKDVAALRALAKKHGLSCAFDDKATLAENAEALLQAGYQHNTELVTIAELQAEAGRHCEAIWTEHPGSRIRFKYIGGGGGKGQRVIRAPEEVSAGVTDILAESKVVAPGANRNFLIELNIETTRHNEIQIIGNGRWCLSLGGRDCSVQMHEQKLLEISLTQEQLATEVEDAQAQGRMAAAAAMREDLAALEKMEREAERLGEAVRLNSVSTFEAIVEGSRHYFMEVNTRIQVEHRVTEQVYTLKFENPDRSGDCFYVDSLVEAMALLALHGQRLPKPERVPRYVSGAEVRINATNAALQPHAGALITSWSAPLEAEQRDDQGIGLRNPDTGSFMYYRVAGAYDSNIALVITHGDRRRDNLQRLAEVLRRMSIRGEDVQTNLDVHYGMLAWILGHDAMVKPSTQFMDRYLAAVGRLASVTDELDMEVAWKTVCAREEAQDAQQVLALKQTLITRPLKRLLARPHALAGFLGLCDGRLWRRDGDQVSFAGNPIEAFQQLYRFLNLEPHPGQSPSESIWDHDRAILDDARAFYGDLQARLGTSDWAEVQKALARAKPPKGFGDGHLWDAVRASHAGFQLGLDLLLVLPRAGAAAGFFEITVGDDLTVSFPDFCLDSDVRATAQRQLAPPPAASSDEIVTPMGGHFYSREAPHLPPLVQDGTRFEAGQPLFVIEVMKMFNKISVPFSGRVTKVMLRDADGTIVKKGDAILKIEPDERIVVQSPEAVAKRRRQMTEKLL